MNANDFELEECNEHDGLKDYYFKVIGESQNILTEKYMEQSMVCVDGVVYSPTDGACGVRMLFPFNEDIRVVEDEELSSFLKELCNW